MYTPTKRIYAPNDPFFQEGNIALRAIWLERDAAESGNDADMVREEADRLAQNYIQPPIYCEMATCTTRGESMAFPSVAAYQLHYEATHRHVCTVCNKHFPGALWLDLHFNECHDVFKQMQKEKGEKIYACFVEGCTKLFSTPKMRRLHLVDKHRYPRYFPFDLPWTGTKTAKPRRSQRSQSHFQVPKPNPSDGSTTSTTTDMDVDTLVSKLSAMKIPRSVSFGRGKPSLQRAPPPHFRSTDTAMKGVPTLQRPPASPNLESTSSTTDTTMETVPNDQKVQSPRKPRKSKARTEKNEAMQF